MITKKVKVDRIDPIIDEIAQRILLELEDAKSSDLSDIRYAKKILHLADMHYTKRVFQQIETKRISGAESEIEKRAVIKVLLFSTWLQRLYFIIRSAPYGSNKRDCYIPFHISPWHNKRCNGNYLRHICVRAFIGHNKTARCAINSNYKKDR